MAPHHEPFRALHPVDWADVDRGNLEPFLDDTFSTALTVVDSIPTPEKPISNPTASSSSSSSPPSSARPRAHTDSAVRQADTAVDRQMAEHGRAAAESHRLARELSREWKEVKVNPRENPLAISVYKLAARDGRGSWFARRSVHDDVSFDKCMLGMRREFAETMKASKKPGQGNIRGIGAERIVEQSEVEGSGKAEVFQLSAQFPGPTTPRDFVTLLLTTDSAKHHIKRTGGRPLRQFIIVSKPCNHPDCAPRQGFIRGQYESVEVIREVPIRTSTPLKRVRSSMDVSRDEAARPRAETENLSKDAVVRLANQAGEPGNPGPHPAADSDEQMAIEWLMITRSDPGGSVPRFMIEKGTPGGIVNDAGKFLKWVSSKKSRDLMPPSNEDLNREVEQAKEAKEAKEAKGAKKEPMVEREDSSSVETPSQTSETSVEPVPSSNGLYGMIAAAIGAAGSAVATRLPNPFSTVSQASTSNPDSERSSMDGTQPPLIAEDEGSSLSDASSARSFASALDHNDDDDDDDRPPTPSSLTPSAETSSLAAPRPSGQEKELRKLEQRHRKAQEKLARLQERAAGRQREDQSRDAASLARMRDKHAREVAKQEDKYRREMRRLEERREQEERKAGERRRKLAEREDKLRLAAELERTAAERDVARKQAEMLREQVGELQRENTMLVARLGRMGGVVVGGDGGVKEREREREGSGKEAAVQTTTAQ